MDKVLDLRKMRARISARMDDYTDNGQAPPKVLIQEWNRLTREIKKLRAVNAPA